MRATGYEKEIVWWTSSYRLRELNGEYPLHHAVFPEFD
jgi:hypothetical protein